jgi:TctA family transporter
MNSAIQNKELTSKENLPRTEDAPQKVVKGKISGVGTGVLLVGGAIVGCFALAVWNRKALTTLVKNRGHRGDPATASSPEESDAIY